MCQGFGRRGEALDHINSLELKAVLLALQNLESLVVGHSVLIRSGQHDGGILHQSSGRDSFLIPVSADLGPVGMVPSAKNFSSCGSHSGSRERCGGFSLQGKIPSYRVGSELRRVSDDLSLVFSSGDRLVRVCSQLPAPEVLLSEPGCSGVEDRCSVVSLDGPSTVRFSSFLSLLPRILDKIAQDEADLLLVAPFWPQRPWFPRLLRLLVGLPRILPVQKDLVVQPMSLIPHPKVESLHLSLWPLSGSRVRKQAFLEELRSLQLRPSGNPLEILDDSRLVPFREWCSKIPCDPSSAPSRDCCGFSHSRLIRVFAVVTLRSYRSAIASCHRGF